MALARSCVFVWLSSVFEGFLDAFAARGVFFRPYIPSGAGGSCCWTKACKYLYARIAALRVLGPSSAWFRIALASMSRASSSGICGDSAVVVVAAGRWVSRSGGARVRGTREAPTPSPKIISVSGAKNEPKN